jgi:hypothetical protein
MVTATLNKLCISISHPDPQQHKDEIIKALSAAIRWRANYQEKYTGDDYNLMILSELLAALVNDA